MPRNSKKDRKPAFELKGFIPVNLDKAGKEAFHKWNEGISDYGSFMDNWLANGYKVSFSNDSYHNCALCSVTCVDHEADFVGYTLAGRGPTWKDALAVAAYKHFIVLEGDWTESVNRPKDSDQWG